MIAKNFIRYPEALRFQVEMFSNGYHNSPRLMRLMTVIFKQVSDVPAWVKEAAAAAKRLVKMWKKAQIVLNFKTPTPKKKPTFIQLTKTDYKCMEHDMQWPEEIEAYNKLNKPTTLSEIQI